MKPLAVDFIFYTNLLVLLGSIYLVSRVSKDPKRFVLFNMLASLTYSAIFMWSTNSSGENMGFLVDHYWTLTIAVHWFLLLLFLIFKKRKESQGN